MRYLMKQKVWSWGDDFTITDEQGQPICQVKGEVFSWGDKLHLYDLQGRELIYIEQQVFNFSPTYEIHGVNGLHARVRKEPFTFFTCRYSIEVAGHGSLQAEGDFTDHEYRILRGGVIVAHISKQWFSWSDTYGVDIASGEDTMLMLALSVVFDMVCHHDH